MGVHEVYGWEGVFLEYEVQEKTGLVETWGGLNLIVTGGC